jgi:selenocysteine lyase/cysteine desulfurase
MLASQQQLFSLSGATYLDCASLSPLPLRAQEVAKRAAVEKARPWLRDRDAAHHTLDTARGLAAQLVGATGEDIAIVSSVSYGLASAAMNLPCSPGDRVLILESDHTSQVLTWARFARQHGAVLDIIRRPADHDWTGAILAHLRDARGPLAVASLSANFWLDGARIDLSPICDELHARGCRIVIDATQAAGILDLNVAELRPDFVVFPTYKWLLGPFSVAFLYVAPQWQHGEPLEQNGFNRVAEGNGLRGGGLSSPYLEGARRFDMGERDTFYGIPTAIAALELLSAWERSAIQARLRRLTDQLASSLEKLGLACLPPGLRCPHILGVVDVPPGAADYCRRHGVHFTQRGSGLRISPHVFNTEEDIDRCAAALESFIASTAAGRIQGART